MIKEIRFGRIDYHGRSANVSVEIDTHLNNRGGVVFSVMGQIGRYSAGQNIAEIARLVDEPLMRAIYRLWERNHLNDMNCGNLIQRTALKAAGLEKAKYDEQKKYLESINLLIAPMSDGEYSLGDGGIQENGQYKFGCGWVYRDILFEDMEAIRMIVKHDYPSGIAGRKMRDMVASFLPNEYTAPLNIPEDEIPEEVILMDSKGNIALAKVVAA